MQKRLLFALWAALVFGATGLAQAPEPAPFDSPAPAETTALPVASVESETIPASPSRLWFTGDYLFTWVRGEKLPPLVTTSVPGTPVIGAGILGQTTTSTLFGDQTVDTSMRSGARLGAGWWVDAERTIAVEAGFMTVESQAGLFAATSTGTPILARPFFNLATSLPDAVLVAFPGNSIGSVEARASSGNFFEAHVDVSEAFINQDGLRVSSLFGYRFFRYDEALHVKQTVLPTTGNFVAGTIVVTDDDFAVQNEFHGLDFGLRAQVTWQNFSLELLGKVAVGLLQRRINIQGSQITTVPGVAPAIDEAGFLALSSNSGLHIQNDWTTMPELGANFNWRINQNVSLRLGYSVIWLDKLVRAADQVDLNINPALLPPAVAGAAATGPLFNLNKRDVWIQSLNFGIEFTF